MSLSSLFKKITVILFLSIFLWRCTEETKFFRGKDPTDVFYQNSSNLYTDVFIQNSSKGITKTFSQNTIEVVEEQHSQITLKTSEKTFTQNAIQMAKEALSQVTLETNTKIFSQNALESVEETFSQVNLDTNRKDFSQKNITIKETLSQVNLETQEVFSQNTLGLETEDSFTQNKSSTNLKPIDILWVIDNSGSMKDNQGSLANNFNSFITNFLDDNIDSLDFRMAIITTDSNTNRVAEGKLTSAHAKKDRSDFENYFNQTIKVGTSGSAKEQGLLYSKIFLQNNRSWIRSNAYLIIICVSDEDDHSPWTIDHFISRMQALKTNPKELRVFSIVNLAGNKVGTRYMEVSQLTNGLSLDIVQSFSTTLNTIGKNVVSLLHSFSLSFSLSKDEVDPDSIKVYVNNVLSPQSKWAYDIGINAVTFKKDATPPENAKIKIRYRVDKLSSSFPLTTPVEPDKLNTIKVFVNDSLVSDSDWEYREQKIHFNTGSIPQESARIKVVYKKGNLSSSFPLSKPIDSDRLNTAKVFVNDSLVSDSDWEYREQKIHFNTGSIPQKSARIEVVYKKGSLSTSFPLTTPIDSDKLNTIKVFVNGTFIPNNKWEYRNQKIHFKTGSIPEESALVKVTYKTGNLSTSFPLTIPIDSDQLSTTKVFVNNTLIPNNKWEYRNQKIHFKAGSVPEDSASIRAVYKKVDLLTSFPLTTALNSDHLSTAKVFVNDSLISRNKWEYRNQKIHFKAGSVPQESARIKLVYNTNNLSTSFSLPAPINAVQLRTAKIYINDSLISRNKWEYRNQKIHFKAESIPEDSASIKVVYKKIDLLAIFPLPAPIDADKLSTLKVFVNDTLMPNSKWEYRNQKIHFKAESIPEDSASIKVVYKKGNLLASFPLEIPLSPARAQAMKVFVNDTRIPNNQWEYRDERIHFTAGFVPAENAKIKLAYKNKDLLDFFPLSTPIDPDKFNTIKVFINDLLIPETDWEYRDVSIKFKENSIPSSSTKIRVEYEGSPKLFTSFALREKGIPIQIDVYVNGVKIPSDRWEYRDHSIHFKENHVPGKEAEIKIVYSNRPTLRTHFYLDHPLDTEQFDTVDITVNGNFTPRNGWEYRSSTNTIHFKEGFVPPAGANIQIVYTNL